MGFILRVACQESSNRTFWELRREVAEAGAWARANGETAARQTTVVANREWRMRTSINWDPPNSPTSKWNTEDLLASQWDATMVAPTLRSGHFLFKRVLRKLRINRGNMPKSLAP